MEPFVGEPWVGDARRPSRLPVWAATAGALVLAVLIFVVTNPAPLTPVAEPVPSAERQIPAATPSTTATTTGNAAAPVPDATTTVPRPTTLVVTRPSRTTTESVRPTTPSAPTTTVRRCLDSDWQRNTAYAGGSVVVHAGHEWTAEWWNYNAEPGANAEGVWSPTRTC
jgi:hypothetical protein